MKKTKSLMNHGKKLILCVFCALCFIYQNTVFGTPAITGQNDSLRQVILNTKGKEKINAQLELAKHLFEIENKEAKSVAQSALSEAKQLRDKTLQMKAFFILGRISHEVNNINYSQVYFDSALTLANELDNTWYQSEILLRLGINQHSWGDHLEALQSFNMSIQAGKQGQNYRAVGASYSMMGTIFRVNGLYDRAIEYIIKSRLNYEKAAYEEGYAWDAYLLGRIYADLQLHDKAMDYFEQALETYEKMATTDNNQSGVVICYEQIGDLNLLSGNTDEARKNIEYTLDIHTESGSKYGISNAYKNLGRIEYTSGNYVLAEKYLKDALAIKKEVGDQLNKPSIYLYLGLCNINTQRTQKGLDLILKGLDQAISNNQKRIQIDIYSKLNEIYLNLNNLEKAIECQQHLISIQDSMLLGAVNIKMEQLQGIYEIDAKNSQIEELEQQNKINRLTLKQHRSSIIFIIIGFILTILGVVVIYFFYRRLRQKKIQLEEANAAKDKFFAIIAHDLRGPIHTQTSFLQHLYREFDSIEEKELRKLLKILLDSSESISDLLNNLLLWAQSQVKKMEVKPTALGLTYVLKTTLEKLQQSANLKQINIKLETDDNLQVMSDADMFQTIIRNIISNAIKFTPRGGAINIKTFASEKNQATINISDTGIGINPDKLSKLFDISFKSHSQGTENEKSNGLGLILVKEFVEKNNGTIHVESEAGKGTSVIFTVPRA
ncbi:tetratricopeptide repeat-containing sensor histidine kinase [Draconibacterium sp. IB214405]|uniref:tetratricopeptide repeat-containing sensor histidine kinase n=1 Tax=Draconibacterium sp. IB214405 TaxID=3097352 RepID=UPI002A1835EA|nr:tetratricopeptide repeat-containing sensor histidine kinase [Draconibacterium sp. IB214405]MDX8337890.1 tetratricopeptide repeat-containing sensor histidine kinase [Draconibacterium sp. IB214405]